MSVTSFANIFSHSDGCLLVLFMVSFAVQKNGTNLTYYVIVSMGQKSRPSSAEFSAEEDLPKLERGAG